jgi:hypothetical protein
MRLAAGDYFEPTSASPIKRGVISDAPVKWATLKAWHGRARKPRWQAELLTFGTLQDTTTESRIDD